MVFKSIIRYMINRYLKNYIEQLDDEKLNYDLRNGHVTLENLHLKPEALVDLSLPVTVAAGYLEKLSLTVPWMNLYSHPTKVHINGLYMLIVPKNELDRDLTEYHANKMKRIQRKVDNLRKAMLENKKLDEKESTFFERMRLQIMQNIEITVEHLHISYETTSTTKLGHPFSFGFTLHYFKITTTTEPNAKKRSKEITPIIYTLKEIYSLSIYWNTKCQSRINMPFNVIVNDLKSKITTNNFQANTNEMNYILYPVNLTVNMVIIITPGEQNFDRSTFNVKAEVRQMSFDIDSKQFSDLLDFGKFQNYSTLYERCREYRELHLQDSIDSTKLNPLQKDRLKILESKLDVFNLAYIRHSVEIEIEKNAASEKASNNKYNRWNSWWKKKNKYAVDDRRSSITTTEAYHDDGFSFYFEDLSNIIVDITMNKLDLYLVQPTTINTSSSSSSSQFVDKRNRQIITHVGVIDTKIDITKQSVSSSLLFELNFRSFRLYGIQDNKSKPSLLVKSISTSSSPMLNIQFELFPINKRRSDYRFFLNIQPIIVIYDASMFNRIVECFEGNTTTNVLSLSKIKERTYTQMEDDLHSHKVFDLTIELKEILLRFPENGLQKKNCSSINIHLGEFQLKSCLDENEIDFKEKSNEERFYIKYKIEINDVRMILSQSDGSYVNILRKIPLIDGTFFKCIYSDDAKLDDWYIDFKIKRMNEVQITNIILEKIISHFQLISCFYSTISEILSRINFYLNVFQSNTSFKGNISIDQSLVLIEINPFTFIQMNLQSSISKRRDKVNKMIVILQNVIMMTKQLSDPIYRNKQLQLNYINN